MAAIAFAAPVSAELSYQVTGVGDKLKSNIIAFVNTVQLGGEVRLSERDYDSVVAKAIANARRALRPFGYYAPVISGRIARDQAGGHVLVLDVNPGPPVVVSSLDLNVVGEGASLDEVRIWRSQWPLNVGKVLDQLQTEPFARLSLEIDGTNGTPPHVEGERIAGLVGYFAVPGRHEGHAAATVSPGFGAEDDLARRAGERLQRR